MKSSSSSIELLVNAPVAADEVQTKKSSRHKKGGAQGGQDNLTPPFAQNLAQWVDHVIVRPDNAQPGGSALGNKARPDRITDSGAHKTAASSAKVGAQELAKVSLSEPSAHGDSDRGNSPGLPIPPAKISPEAQLLTPVDAGRATAAVTIDENSSEIGAVTDGVTKAVADGGTKAVTDGVTKSVIDGGTGAESVAVAEKLPVKRAASDPILTESHADRRTHSAALDPAAGTGSQQPVGMDAIEKSSALSGPVSSSPEGKKGNGKVAADSLPMAHSHVVSSSKQIRGLKNQRTAISVATAALSPNGHQTGAQPGAMTLPDAVGKVKRSGAARFAAPTRVAALETKVAGAASKVRVAAESQIGKVWASQTNRLGDMPAIAAGPQLPGSSSLPPESGGPLFDDFLSGVAPQDLSELPAIETEMNEVGFRNQLSDRVSIAIRQGLERARIQVHPVELGPVNIELNIEGQQAFVSFGAAHAETREAIRASLDELRQSLNNHGLELAGADVSSGGEREWHEHQNQANDGRADSAQRQSSADIRPERNGNIPIHNRSTGTGTVDVFV